MTNHIYILTTVAVLMLFSSTHSAVFNQEINCGVGTLVNETYTVVRTTTDIPFVTRQNDPEYAFGCAVNYPHGELSLRSNITVPNPNPATLTTNAYLSTQSSKDKIILESEEVTFDTKGYVGLQLDNSDNTGVYIIEIFINNKLSRTVRFNVYK